MTAASPGVSARGSNVTYLLSLACMRAVVLNRDDDGKVRGAQVVTAEGVLVDGLDGLLKRQPTGEGASVCDLGTIRAVIAVQLYNSRAQAQGPCQRIDRRLRRQLIALRIA